MAKYWSWIDPGDRLLSNVLKMLTTKSIFSTAFPLILCILIILSGLCIAESIHIEGAV